MTLANRRYAGAAVASPSADDEYLTTDEVAARLRVHPTTILRRLGAMDDPDPTRIPAVRVGRVWRIPRREFEEWLARSSQAARQLGRQRRLF
ncbi:MAG: helix-turn-helix domain-containing protein [Chloroflexi bacterium]|nr:MAG: helix-turn-helix domain-containing protein [Chloroflexota bacterium]